MDLSHGLSWDASAYFVSALPVQGVASYTRIDTQLKWKFAERAEISLVGQNLLQDRSSGIDGCLDPREFVPDQAQRLREIHLALLVEQASSLFGSDVEICETSEASCNAVCSSARLQTGISGSKPVLRMLYGTAKAVPYKDCRSQSRVSRYTQPRNTPGSNIVLPREVAQFIELALHFLHLRLKIRDARRRCHAGIILVQGKARLGDPVGGLGDCRLLFAAGRPGACRVRPEDRRPVSAYQAGSSSLDA